MLSVTRIFELGFDNLPKGWTQKSVEKFARSLTGKTKEDSHGFFDKCVQKMKDESGFSEESANKFCASLKDQYLGTTKWRDEESEKEDD